MKRASGLPFTPEELADDIAARRRGIYRGLRRRRAAHSQNYNIPGNPDRKRRDDAIMGESVDNEHESSKRPANHTGSKLSR